MLLSIKITIRSSLSFERALLWITAREKDLFTATLFSSYSELKTSGTSQQTALFLNLHRTFLVEDKLK